MPITFGNVLLFTGAGFTANFGGFLSRQMWSWIFNNPKLNNAGQLKHKLRQKFDFEEIYSDVFDERSDLPSHEIDIFKDVVNEAYVSMDNVIQSGWDSLPIHPSDVKRFLDRFVTATCACFTLNQDMTMEKRLGWRPLVPHSMNYSGSWGDVSNQDLNSDTPKQLPTSEDLEVFRSQVGNANYYIKLHGSLRWVNSDGGDSKVIGINKMNTIARIPLLNWYFELFRQAISAGNVKLLIIGYGFRDSHINQLLAEACENNGLKLFIMSPENVESFLDNLLYRGQGQSRSADEIGTKIWNGVVGYFPYKFSQIFPYSQRTLNPELSEICNALGLPLVT